MMDSYRSVVRTSSRNRAKSSASLSLVSKLHYLLLIALFMQFLGESNAEASFDGQRPRLRL